VSGPAVTGSAVRARLAAARLELPAVAAPRSRYVPLRRHGDLVFCAGVTSDGVTGLAGECAIELARAAARVAALRQLAYLEAGIGSLDAVTGVLRMTGYVACTPGFGGTPEVIDAASEVFLAAFGPASGAHARSAVGVAGLPGGALVELEAIVTVNGQAGAGG
jgi:enamine deaminase RidA (YjgF/YER057c/UK114 family)